MWELVELHVGASSVLVDTPTMLNILIDRSEPVHVINKPVKYNRDMMPNVQLKGLYTNVQRPNRGQVPKIVLAKTAELSKQEAARVRVARSLPPARAVARVHASVTRIQREQDTGPFTVRSA